MKEHSTLGLSAFRNTCQLFLISLLISLFFSCNKEENFITGGAVTLEFSADTLRFDTVFTQLGSATRSIRVYNRNDRPVRIARIALEGGSTSFFRLNIDGDPGDVAENVEIRGNDSLWIFAEVTIDPDQPLSVSPFVVSDRIKFTTGDKEQVVHLEAWGQNANYLPNRFSRGVPSLLTCDFGEVTWDDPKPYVIYGELFIDSCALHIPAGARIHVHGGVAKNELFDGTFNDGMIWVLDQGQIRITGTPDNPVILQGDRLEESFAEEEGQWTGLIIGKGSKGNVIEYTTIKNSIFGVYVDSTATLTARNSRFYNTVSSGIIGFHSTITAENCLVYNNFSNSVQLIHGGNYRFTYCTVASYGVNASALGMSNFFCYDNPTTCQDLGIFALYARFINSIIFGSRRDELILSDISGGNDPGLFDVQFQNCIVRTDELLEQQDNLYADFYETICDPCINGDRDTPLFADPNEDDYHLDSLSVAIGQAQPVLTPQPIMVDLENKPRDGEMPDVGCFERD
jgi:hypothetical protein